MFNIDNRFDFFDEPISFFEDIEPDFSFEKDRRTFEDYKIESNYKIRQIKYKNFFENYTIVQTRDLHLADFSNNSQWTEIDGILQNRDIGDSQSATLEGSFDNVTTISFDCKVSSEANYDFLTIYINGEQKIRISGEVDWQTHTYEINGDLDFKAVYSKDGSVSNGADTGYLRNICITQQSGVVTEPMRFAILRDFKSSNILSPFKIANYNNIMSLDIFEIKEFLNKKQISWFAIKNYKSKKNYCFERISFMQIPPKRVIIRDFNE